MQRLSALQIVSSFYYHQYMVLNGEGKCFIKFTLVAIALVLISEDIHLDSIFGLSSSIELPNNFILPNTN